MADFENMSCINILDYKLFDDLKSKDEMRKIFESVPNWKNYNPPEYTSVVVVPDKPDPPSTEEKKDGPEITEQEGNDPLVDVPKDEETTPSTTRLQGAPPKTKELIYYHPRT